MPRPDTFNPTDVEACLDRVHGDDAADVLASALGPAIALRLSLEIANLRADVARLTSRLATATAEIDNADKRAERWAPTDETVAYVERMASYDGDADDSAYFAAVQA